MAQTGHRNRTIGKEEFGLLQDEPKVSIQILFV